MASIVSASSIPPELHPLITECISEATNLKRICLVCHEWRKDAQRCLFRRLRLPTTVGKINALTTILESSSRITSAVRIVEIPQPDDVEPEKVEAYLAAVALFLIPGRLFTQSFSIILKGPNLDIQLLRSLSTLNIGSMELHYSFPSYLLYRAFDEIPSLANGGGLSLPPASCHPLDCTHPDKTIVLGAEAQALTLEQIRKDEEPSLSEKRKIGSLAIDVAAVASVIPLLGHFNWDKSERLNLSWHWWQSCQDAVRVSAFRDMMETFLTTVGRNVTELKLRVYSGYESHYGGLEKERMIGMWA
jgi:hypothetical protein